MAACASPSTGFGTGNDAGDTPPGEAGTDAEVPVPVEYGSTFLALALRGDGATGVVYEGNGFFSHSFPGEAALGNGPVAATSVATDHTGLVVWTAVAAGPAGGTLRFAEWKGGETWTEFANVPSALSPDAYLTPMALMFRAGVHMLAYGVMEGSTPKYVYQLFDPKTGAWTEPRPLAPETQYPSSIRLAPSAASEDEIYITITDGPSARVGSFRPSFDAAPPDLTLIPVSNGTSSYPNATYSLALTPVGATQPVQVTFSLFPSGDPCPYYLPGASPQNVPSECALMEPIVPRVRTSSTVTLLCSLNDGENDDTREMVGTLAGDPPSFTWQVTRDTPLGWQWPTAYLPGIPPDTSYVVGVLSNSGTGAPEAGFVKNLDSEFFAFANGESVGASVGP